MTREEVRQEIEKMDDETIKSFAVLGYMYAFRMFKKILETCE